MRTWWAGRRGHVQQCRRRGGVTPKTRMAERGARWDEQVGGGKGGGGEERVSVSSTPAGVTRAYAHMAESQSPESGDLVLEHGTGRDERETRIRVMMRATRRLGRHATGVGAVVAVVGGLGGVDWSYCAETGPVRARMETVRGSDPPGGLMHRLAAVGVPSRLDPCTTGHR